MSRIGKLPISIPTGVTVTLKDNVVTVKGPKGELSQFVDPSINVAIEDGHVMLTENENAMLDNVKQRHAFHGFLYLYKVPAYGKNVFLNKPDPAVVCHKIPI